MDVSRKNRHTIIPTSKDFGKRVDAFLAQSKDFEEIVGAQFSRTHIARGIRKGGVLLKSEPLTPHTKLLQSTPISIIPDAFTSAEETLRPEPDIPITVIAETPSCIIINKPAGIQVHPSTARETSTVAQWILAHFPEIAAIGEPMRPGIVHRLDRDTSGLLILARTQKSFTALKKLFQSRSIHKRYLAIVHGVPEAKEGIITTPIARSTRGDRQSAALPGRRVKGIIRPAETSYRVLKAFNDAALVEAAPKTGRTHQIRVHLASIGHPVLGDALYASKASRTKESLPARQLLHAAHLSFTLFGKKYRYDAPLPDDFAFWYEHFTNQPECDNIPR